MYEAKEKVTGMIKKNDRGDYIRVARVIPAKGLEAIDIRNFYTNNDGEQCPTAKGVRVNSEIMIEVIQAILKCLDEYEREELS